MDDHFYLAFNASHEPIDFSLPSDDYAQGWTTVLDTAEMDEVEPVEQAGRDRDRAGRAIVVLHGPRWKPGYSDGTGTPAAGAAEGAGGHLPAAGPRRVPPGGRRRGGGYLADLGVTHAYLTAAALGRGQQPRLRHGRPRAHRRGAGRRPGFDRFVAALHERGLGLVLDLVPNHMGVADPAAAPWWWDVLQHGQGSAHAAAFDIDWAFGGGKVRIPVRARRTTSTSWRWSPGNFGTTTTAS